MKNHNQTSPDLILVLIVCEALVDNLHIICFMVHKQYCLKRRIYVYFVPSESVHRKESEGSCKRVVEGLSQFGQVAV